MTLNPVFQEIFRNKFLAIAEEMGVTLNRTAFSSNIKERRDFSCAIFDHHGETIAQAAHIPVHLGSMPLCVKAVIEKFSLHPFDMMILNDPFLGGTHLPDITIVAPVFFKGDQPVFYIANRAHHADVGGMSSGSMPLSTSIFQEGIIIPPLKIVEQGTIDRKIMEFLINNVRTPTEREGDLSAQIMSNFTGIQRLKLLLDKYGQEMVVSYAAGLQDYSERIMRQAITGLPDGTYEFKDYLDDDGISTERIPIGVAMTVAKDEITLDFSPCGPQVKGCVNAVKAITYSAVNYVFQSLIENDFPNNAGCMRPIKILTQVGTVVDANFPAAVAGGNVETSQRIVDVILGALAQAIPERVPAASQGTMNNIAIGGVDPQTMRPFTYYETLAGGNGGSMSCHGESATHSHMTNTLNTPIEALELAFPLQVTKYAIRKDSGGNGRFKGGDGLVREIKLLCDAELSVLSDRRQGAPYGLEGGSPGKPGENQIIDAAGTKQRRPGKFTEQLKAGTRVCIETPGGGGFGKLDLD